MSSNKELFEKIDQLVEKAPENRHSYYQLKYFMLGKEPTTQSQLWQCLRQLQGKKETIQNIKLQIEDTNDEIELLVIKKERLEEQAISVSEELRKRELTIKLRKLKRREESLIDNINKLERKLTFEIEESRFYVQAFEALEALEPLKDYDDFDAQSEYWEAVVREDINLRIISGQAMSSEILKTALALHEGSSIKQQTLIMLEDLSKKIAVKVAKETDDRKQIVNK
jgi:hypothetical protein